MKKIILALGFVLGLGGLTATQAQMKVLSNGNVKMGGMISSTSTEYGLEIGYTKIRITPFAKPVANNDIRIYSDCPTIGGPITMSADADPNAIGGINCKTVIEGDNLYIGTRQVPMNAIGNVLSPTSSGVSVISDRRYKDNIRPMVSGLAEILRLQPVRFDYKRIRDNETSRDSLARMNQVGFIAQDVEAVVPEAVHYDPYEDLYALNQTALIPFLVAGIRELNATVQELTDRIERLEADNAALSTPAYNSSKPDNTPTGTLEAPGNRLWSNVPNPFKQETRIRYALTDDVREAQLCIYDLSGRQLSCHRLNDRGQSEFVLRAASLNPGIYLYSLIADGQVVDTHRMVVTE